MNVWARKLRFTDSAPTTTNPDVSRGDEELLAKKGVLGEKLHPGTREICEEATTHATGLARCRCERRPHPDAPPQPDAGQPANLGWIGGTCAGVADCHFTGAICLGADFPEGLCTEECTDTCPDRHQPRDTVTACVDARPFDFDQGLCVSRCDQTVWPGSGCAPGLQCLPKSRYGTPTTILSVCVPAVTPAGCPDGQDELVPLAYPQHGSVWIPAEAQCGGSFPLVVMLHGINPAKNQTPSLGGGRRLEYEVRSLIDAHLMDPVVLAEPVQDDDASAASTTLYDSAEFNPAHHLDLVGGILGPLCAGLPRALDYFADA